MPNKEDIANSFAVKNGYDGVTFQEIWNDNNVFVAENNDDDGKIIGYPTYILVSPTNAVRFSTSEETQSILGLTSPPKNYSETLS